jgi:hypothetical protein
VKNLRSSIGRGLQLLGIGVTGIAALMFFSPKIGMWPLLYISLTGVAFFALGLLIEGRFPP